MSHKIRHCLFALLLIALLSACATDFSVPFSVPVSTELPPLEFAINVDRHGNIFVTMWDPLVDLPPDTEGVYALPGYQGSIIRIVVGEQPRYEIIGIDTIPVRNCIGGNVVTFSYSLSKSTSQEITVEGGGNVGLEVAIKTVLELHYSMTSGEQVERAVEIQIEVQPGKNLEYQAVWREVWFDGYVVVRNPDGTQVEVPFSVKQDVQVELRDPVDLGCH